MAQEGDAAAMYLYAQWLETSCVRVQEWIPMPCEPDVRGGYEWLVRASEAGDAKAMYVLGVRLKYDWHVYAPIPPVEGTEVIRRAKELGFESPVPEDETYAAFQRGEL